MIVINNTEAIKVNYPSDFKIIVTSVKDREGNTLTDVSTVHFYIEFMDLKARTDINLGCTVSDSRKYICSYDGTTRVNNEIVDGKIVLFFEDYPIKNSYVYYRQKDSYSNDSFDDTTEDVWDSGKLNLEIQCWTATTLPEQTIYAEISISALQGKSAYDEAVEGGYTGTEEEFQQSLANIVNKADKVVNAVSGNFAGLDANGNPTDSGKKASDFADKAGSTSQTFDVATPTGANNATTKNYVDGKLATKADLGADGYVKAPQLNPLAGRVTGAQMGAGYLKNDALSGVSSRSYEILFKPTGTSDTTAWLLYDGSNTNKYLISIYQPLNTYTFNFSALSSGFYQKTLEKDKVYHIVMTVDLENNLQRIFINGTSVAQTNNVLVEMAPTQFRVGGGYNNYHYYNINAQLLQLRMFNYVLSAEEVATLFNGGKPAEYMLPNTGTMRSGLVAEWLPEGLLSDGWRDTSGNGNDLTYIPATAGASTVPTYQSPAFAEVLIGTTAPNRAADYIGQRWINTATNDIYMAYGNATASQWKTI